MADEATAIARRIKERLAKRGGIGPGFSIEISALPSEWQALLDAIPMPEPSCPACGQQMPHEN